MAGAPACASEPAPASDLSLGTGAPVLFEEDDVPVGAVTQMDVFALDGGSSLPVAALLHGTVGNRSAMYGLARALAEGGATG